MAPTESQLEDLCRSIAPADLGGHPVYVAFASKIPDHLRVPSGLWGFHHLQLDLVLASWLRESKRWAGRGPAIVINDEALKADAIELAGSDKELREELYSQRIFAVTVHEFSHALSEPFDLRKPPESIAREIEKDLEGQASEAISGIEAYQEANIPAPWNHHEAHFIRVLIHATRRAEALLCRKLVDRHLFTNHHYELSRLDRYRIQLRREIEAFDSSVTFADLHKCQPPREFIELWKSDLHRWWNQNNRDSESTLHLAAAMSPYINHHSQS